MIDIESKVFNTVADAIANSTEFSSALVLGEYNEIPASFPCVTIIEEDNTTLQSTQDDSLQENHANVMYEVNVYCTGDSKKANCKKLANLVDTTMQSMKFTRSFFGQTPNQDRTIYRMTLRYTAIVGKGVTSGNVTKYQMYRRA